MGVLTVLARQIVRFIGKLLADISLDEYINLRERVENRMIIVDMTSTGDDNVLTAKSNDIATVKTITTIAN